MGTWTIYIYLLLPFPLFALLLDTLPFPLFLKRFNNNLVEKLMFTPFVGQLNLYQIATALSLLMFIMTAYETRSEKKSVNNTHWRNERNFWIATFSLTLWLVLHRVQWLSRSYYQTQAADATRKEAEREEKKE